MTTTLPTEFADLEPFAARWSLTTEAERYAERLSSSMDDMQAFYDAAFPRMEAALAYCDQLDIDDLPPEARNLMRLLFSLVTVSFPVEAWKQPHVPDSGASALHLVDEPII